ncbi:MAG: DMT family transporter [candidate division WOR-3 bacterium]
MNKDKEAYIYVFLVILFWSTVASAFKLSLRYLNFVQLLFWSSLTAFLILFIIIVFQKKLHLLRESFKNDWKSSLFCGFLNPFLYYMVLFKAYSLLPAQEAQPLNQTWAIVLVLFSGLFLKQPIRIKSIVAIFISFIGVLIITTHGDFKHLTLSNPQGVILALGSAFIWALYWIANLKDDRDEIIKLFSNFFFGLLFIIPLIVITNNLKPSSCSGLLGGIYVGIFEMGITFLFWLKALKFSASIAGITNLIYFIPFLSLVLISLTVGEKISPWTILGLAFIVVGNLIQHRR